MTGLGAATGAGWVETVLGPVDPAGLGPTLLHEHVRMDARPLLAAHGYAAAAAPAAPFDARTAAEARWNPGVHPDDYALTDEDLMVEELLAFRGAGGGTIVDVTPVELGRAPDALQRIATRTGLHIVMGAGHYLRPVHPEALDALDEDAITGRLVGECGDGVDGSGIRPGIIGEIGTGDPPHPAELRIVRAAARAAPARARAGRR